MSLNAIFNTCAFAAERSVGLESDHRVCGDDKLRSLVDQLSKRRFPVEDADDLVARCFDELADP